ncbi:hypothetical protein [Actinacidiphila glaucinigra]|uniref:Uncharacterized protein n=1 Tax=Actinacidiphila glaucinigra TaxID=235986 RepID=A0A239FQE7_9ACTN|nr:hypothetical protein [Actinacidiphila glaucinigra]SNS58868.1 hypothetical protein SAMN05216252_10724 [Actinacidiphila glaucinigra]
MTETNHIAVVTAAGERRDGRATGPEQSPAGGSAPCCPGAAAHPIRPCSTALAVPVNAGATAV